MKFWRVCLNRPEEEFGKQEFSEEVSNFESYWILIEKNWWFCWNCIYLPSGSFWNFFVGKVLASLISHIQLVVLELLLEFFRTEGCENCIPRVFIWKFWWKTNVFYKCNFSNSFWHWAKNVQTFDNGSSRDIKTALTCPEEDFGKFFQRKVFNFISIFEFSTNSFRAFEKK